MFNIRYRIFSVIKSMGYLCLISMISFSALAGGSIFGGNKNKTVNTDGVYAIGIHICSSLECPPIRIIEGTCDGEHMQKRWGVCVCDAGYVSENGVCKTCPEGQYSDGIHGCTGCEAGTYKENESDTSCQPCPDNSYCVAGKAYPCPEHAACSATNFTCNEEYVLEYGACVLPSGRILEYDGNEEACTSNNLTYKNGKCYDEENINESDCKKFNGKWCTWADESTFCSVTGDCCARNGITELYWGDTSACCFKSCNSETGWEYACKEDGTECKTSFYSGICENDKCVEQVIEEPIACPVQKCPSDNECCTLTGPADECGNPTPELGFTDTDGICHKCSDIQSYSADPEECGKCTDGVGSAARNYWGDWRQDYNLCVLNDCGKNMIHNSQGHCVPCSSNDSTDINIFSKDPEECYKCPDRFLSYNRTVCSLCTDIYEYQTEPDDCAWCQYNGNPMRHMSGSLCILGYCGENEFADYYGNCHSCSEDDAVYVFTKEECDLCNKTDYQRYYVHGYDYDYGYGYGYGCGYCYRCPEYAACSDMDFTCNPGFTKTATGCECGEGKYVDDNGNCVISCAAPQTYNIDTGKCECPNNLTKDGNVCICTSYSDNECGLGYYCLFNGENNGCDPNKFSGVCTAITEVRQTPGGYYFNPDTALNWQSAYSWCTGIGSIGLIQMSELDQITGLWPGCAGGSNPYINDDSPGPLFREICGETEMGNCLPGYGWIDGCGYGGYARIAYDLEDTGLLGCDNSGGLAVALCSKDFYTLTYINGEY